MSEEKDIGSMLVDLMQINVEAITNLQEVLKQIAKNQEKIIGTLQNLINNG
tara:strand:- start:98 stop:250 length:153 start_codon:yes stop_codon:yes gene_type:complete